MKTTTLLQKWEQTKLYRILDTLDTWCVWYFVNPFKKIAHHLLTMLVLFLCLPVLPYFIAKHNGCITLDDGRSVRHIFATIFKGWNPSETWSLDYTFCKWFLPRLKYYNDKATNLFIMKPRRVKELYELQDIIERMVKDNYGPTYDTPYEEWQETKDIKRFQKLLPKHIVSMWW